MLHKIFIGTYVLEYKLNPAIKNQAKNVKRVWNNSSYKDFGIERVARLFLVMIQFVFPALYVRDITGRTGLLGRKLGVECYVLLKLFLPIIFFKLHLTGNFIVFAVTIYLLVETVTYLLSLILLSDIYASPITYKRSILLLFINFIEIGLEYAIIFSYLSIHTTDFFNRQMGSAIEIIYFSFVSFSTLGFGDISINDDTGRLVVISQIFTFILFVGLFLNFYASKIHDLTYFNTKEKAKWKKNITNKVRL
ncbi:MAG: hypothetical protein JRI37_15945 [Deltaproteobacteria bacterium]|nr:hypothetical protein [Deltaproteobacteria bacterium]